MEKRIKAGFLAILALALAVSCAGTLYRADFFLIRLAFLRKPQRRAPAQG